MTNEMRHAVCKMNALLFFVTLVLAVSSTTLAQYVNPGPAVFINTFVPLALQPPRNRTCDPPAYDVLKSHSRFWGCRNRTDRIVFSETVDKPGRFFGGTREKVVEYPGQVPKGHVRNEIITAIWCYDLMGYNNGGYCEIQSGGVGKTHVRLYLKQSQWNTALRFRVEIYGNTTHMQQY